MASSNSAEDENSSRRVNLIAMTTPNLNATATFKAGMLDLERRMNAAGDKRSCVTCFGRQNSMHNLGRPSQVQMSGKKILKALSSFSCISSKSISMSNSPSKREQQQRSLDLKDGVVKRSPAFEDKGKSDQRILLRIVMWGGPNTLLLLAPFDAPAESVIEMVLDSYVKGVGLHECQDYELFCAHCNSPALHPKQTIGSVGSRHFLLCKKGPGVVGPNYFNSSSQVAKHSHSSVGHHHSRHNHNSHSHSGSTALSSRSHSFRSLSHSNSSLSTSSMAQHGRSHWWNPVKCLSIGGHH
ncbi:hypothetical protein MPTK1_3g00980 [Marchantia polymorpha subsp. ruderalis]|uniref:DUF7054 domain-containing protein n=2 Tax=Marchantia polymorpha TaxID=3197 RepID=A0AAF6AW33_MARPO|nr:hypothetical protein MARPO_0007s0094 [Marchantia polymorpha]BBN03967.1 hypothetical protein Mp_3g00980 [Marchantia polymorpha subsp. ruderalis]|eukprot:PTQ47656.1 hypothetical protein MARPO_0007s0094 [Marchantia polymorpha]